LDADDPLPSSVSGPSTLITFENTFTTEVPMSGKAAFVLNFSMDL
jgi:hypothetical protein